MKTKLLYFFILLMSFQLTSGQEVLTFSAYNGSPATITATTSTVNDEITIVFEDSDIINNFYTDGRTYIHMFGGLDTPSGGFQGSPSFGDLGAQPQLNLVSGDSDVNAAPNTYSITINLATHYSGVADGTTVYGFNLLFQNEFGGGGNNQTADLYIDLIDAMKDSTLNIDDFENSINTFYANNSLNINGYQGKANIKAYDVLGKMILNKEDIQISSSFSTELNLPKNQLFIVVIESNTFKKVLKIISK